MPLVIHIGYHKTGSSALQSYLAKNREILAERKVIVPPSLSSWLGHPEFAWAFWSSRFPWQDRDYALQEVKAHYVPYLKESQSHDKIVIISSEEFCRLEYSVKSMLKLVYFISEYEPIIIGYFRKPIDFLLSRYRHEIQLGAETRKPRDFLFDLENVSSADFQHRTSVWEQFFTNRCIFRPAEDALNTRSIVANFFRLLDIEGLGEDDKASEFKLHPYLCDAGRAINRLNMEYHIKARLFDELFSLSEKLPPVSMRDYFEETGLLDDLKTNIFLSVDKINATRDFATLVNSKWDKPRQRA